MESFGDCVAAFASSHALRPGKWELHNRQQKQACNIPIPKGSGIYAEEGPERIIKTRGDGQCLRKRYFPDTNVQNHIRTHRDCDSMHEVSQALDKIPA